MIRPAKNLLINRFFSRYIEYIIKQHFYRVQFNPTDFEADKSVLLIANHFSWWDGFLLYYINKKHFKKNFYIMVLEETMRKLPFFKYLGAFSVKKNSKDVIESLGYASMLLQNTKNMVVIFPQGKLYSNFVDYVEFGKGISKVIAGAPHNFQIVFSATFIEHFENKKPGAFIYLSKQNLAEPDFNNLAQSYREYYTKSKSTHSEISI